MVRKRFGQHFLEPAWVAKVVRAIDPQPTETFLEIGPGGGALTRPLLSRAAGVTAFEIDRDLAAALRDTDPRLTVVEGDFLDTADALGSQARTALRVAGNLPYNVASPILFKLLELHAAGAPLLDATLMLQREVAERLIAPPGGREYGVLSVMVQYAADVALLLLLPPGAFRPPPKVKSALIQVRFRAPTMAARDPVLFATIVQAVFTRRRKTLANALLAFPGSARLSPIEALARAGIDGRRRPETLGIDEFVRLADIYTSVGGGPPTDTTRDS
jgi:16S rRNA (adenine1518-N6/adenine1519-N6)-dimethyltransferase